MALNSKRERILVALVTELEAIAALSTVNRIQPAGLSSLKGYAETQLPLVAVCGQLPRPTQKRTTRTGHTVDKVISVLGVRLFVYALDNVTPDSTISNLADDIWAKLLADETHGFKWVLGTEIEPNINTAVWDPYCAVNLQVNIEYLHDKGGI